MKKSYTHGLILSGLLLMAGPAAFAQRHEGNRGGNNGQRSSGQVRQQAPGRSADNRQRDIQRPSNRMPDMQRRQTDNRQREWQQRQNVQRNQNVPRNNDAIRQQNDIRQRQRQQTQNDQRAREIRANNDRQMQQRQQAQRIQRSRDMQRGSFDNRNDIRRQQARVNRPAQVYNRPNSFRNRSYAYGYRPRYTRPPVVWGGRRYYTFYNYYYHPYRPYYYGSFFHPVGYFRIGLGSAAISIILNGNNYWYDEGIFYQPYNSGYQVIPAPDGAYISRLPVGYTTIDLGGNTYYYFAGTFYATSAQGFVVTDAPPGAIVYDLPEGCSEIQVDGMTYLQYNGTTFQPIMIDGRDAYEVVALDEDYDG